MSRSTVALASVFGISSSKPDGCRLGADGDGASLVGGIDEAVEPFGGIEAHRRSPMSINDDQLR